MSEPSAPHIQSADASNTGPRAPLHVRLFQRRVGAMLVRNTIVSTGVFLFGLALMAVLVELLGVDAVVASGIGFLAATSLHYALGRSWIFRGTERPFASGYVFFIANALVGLALTMGLMAIFLQFTALHYLVARVLVSVVAGLVVFVLNAVWNFRRV